MARLERGVLERAGDVLLAVAAPEPDRRHPRRSDQLVELDDQAVMVLVERRWRRDREAPVHQELHEPTLILQARHIAPDADAVHRRATKLTCSASSLATVPMVASSPTVAAVDRRVLTSEDAMGTTAPPLRRPRDGSAGPTTPDPPPGPSPKRER